jgi:diadenosine tetraphosphate (Ap4A) HIT family hydrolase
MSREDAFVLDARLEADTTEVCRLDLCTVLLMNDARFPWLILVPRRPGMADLIDLDATDRANLTEEIDRASRVLMRETRGEKLNVAALGNMVRQLHVHVIARFAHDAAWPGPVWGVGKAAPYDDTARQNLIGAVRTALDSA